MYTSSSNFRTRLFAAVLAVATLSPAMYAQNPTRAEAKIPFAFQIGASHFEAGTYTVRDLAQHIISVGNGSHSAIAVTGLETGLNPSTSGKIVFRKYGDKYFLAEVWTEGDTVHMTIARSKTEDNMRKMAVKTASVTPETRIEVALLQEPK